MACTWRRSARFLTRCIRKTGFLQSRKEERLVKNRKTSKGNSVDVSVKKPVESTGENRLKEVVQIQGEEGKDSLKKKMMKNTCTERKQPEIVPVKAGEKKHSGNKKSKAKKTVTKSPNHGQNPVKTQKKALKNRVKRSGMRRKRGLYLTRRVKEYVWKRRLSRFNLKRFRPRRRNSPRGRKRRRIASCCFRR